jgi:hypothetical protein
MPIAPPTSSDLNSLRQELSQPFSKFGLTLARAINRKATRGLSKSYVIKLCRGQRVITPAIARAFWRIVAAYDEIDPAIATLREVAVQAEYDIAGALVSGPAVPCARPGCRVRFVKTHPLQKYHSPYCRQKAYTERIKL